MPKCSTKVIFWSGNTDTSLFVNKWPNLRFWKSRFSIKMNVLRTLTRLPVTSIQISTSYVPFRGAAGGPKKTKGAAAGKPKKVWKFWRIQKLQDFQFSTFDFEFQLLEVEKDPVKLTTYLCGSNYKLEGEDVQLKPDSEYPDWLFTMDIKRPKPKSWEIEDKQSLEYFRATALEAKVKWKRLHQKGLRGLRDRK